MAEKMSAKFPLQRPKASLSAFSAVVVMLAFLIAIITDVLDIVADISVVASFFSSIMSIFADISLGILWWSVGVGSGKGGLFSNKYGKRWMGTALIEFVPFLNMLPAYTFMCILNLLDLMGYLKYISHANSNNSAGNVAG